jgi:hypothetical protein
VSSIVPFYRIDQKMALDDAVFVTDPDGEVLLVVDAYCVQPTCPCDVAHLRIGHVARLKGITIPAPAEVIFPAMDEIEKLLIPSRLYVFDLVARELRLPEGVAPFPREDETMCAMQREFQDEIAGRWMAHRRAASEWGKTHWWRVVDWSDIPAEQESISWEEVHPATPELFFEHRGLKYLVDDHYFIDSRPRREMFVSFLRPVEGKDKREDLAGTVLFSMEEGRPRLIAVRHGNWQRVQKLFQDFAASNLEIFGEYKRRAKAMREFGALVEEQQRPEEGLLPECGVPTQPVHLSGILPPGGPGPSSSRPAAVPRRNDPCPCGSGRKYKNCCGR